MCIFKILWEKQSFIFCQTKHDSFWCSSFLLGIRNSNYQSAWRTLFGISYTLSLLRHTSTIFLYLKNSLLAFTFDRFMAWIKNSWSIVVTSPFPPPAAAPTLLFYCPASSVVSYKNLTLILISLYVMCLLFLFCEIFLFIFVPQQFDYVYLGVDVFALILFGVFWASSIYTSMSFTQIWRFSALFSCIILSFHLLKLQLYLNYLLFC